MEPLRGTYPIVPTPFNEDGSLDEDSIRSLTGFMVGCGVQGLAILGVMGEAHKLTESEKAQTIRAFRTALPSHLHLVVGTGAAATDPAIQLSQMAAANGADALLVGPPPIQNDDVIFDYYQRIAAAVDLPIILHDYPASTGILMSVPLIARLYREIPNVRYIKLEDPPTGPKIQQVLEATEGGIGVFGALGGVYAFEELDRGALGIMTGFAYPDLLVEMQRLYDAGDRQAAAYLFYKMVPLIRFEFQPGIGVSLRKILLVRRGAIRHATVRHPGAMPDSKTLEHLDMILAYLREQGLGV